MGSTNNELVEILTTRNIDGRYKELIENASNNFYHDFRSPNPLPKSHLVYDLGKFPELNDIVIKVRNGDFDECMFDQEDWA